MIAGGPDGEDGGLFGQVPPFFYYVVDVELGGGVQVEAEILPSWGAAVLRPYGGLGGRGLARRLGWRSMLRRYKGIGMGRGWGIGQYGGGGQPFGVGAGLDGTGFGGDGDAEGGVAD